MKGRIALVGGVVAVLVGMVGVAPAGADFHGLCAANTSPNARVGMVLSGSTITYTGTVRCDGLSITIDSVRFTATDGAGRTSLPPVSAACTNCVGPLSASGTYATAGAGTYSAVMAFTITTSTGGQVRLLRTVRAAWAGTGPLIVLCGGNDAGGQQRLCPPDS